MSSLIMHPHHHPQGVYTTTPSNFSAISSAMDDDENGGLLNIHISDSEEDTSKKTKRTGQTESEFLAVKRDYKAKVENGEASNISFSAQPSLLTFPNFPKMVCSLQLFRQPPNCPARSTSLSVFPLVQMPISSMSNKFCTPLKNFTSSDGTKRR